ncbi:MAG: hypothetical protein ACRD0L_00615 [Acidimicrobiales bacterium]
MRISARQRAENEVRIRATMERLLGGDIPSGGGCDVKTLAAQSGLDRRAFYGERAYAHLREQFEARLAQSIRAGDTPDERQGHIARLKHQLATLTKRLGQRDETIDELTEFKSQALSRLAAQHDEITHLRASLAEPHNIHPLPARTRTIGPVPAADPHHLGRQKPHTITPKES